jgi:carbon starvation protein
MSTLLVAVGSFFAFILAYHTYGRWLARRIFGLDPDAVVPSQQLRDDVDFVPTKKEVIFGHHFTSIAGTGPIVGPAIAVFWGWLPALLWVVFGSIFIGAVHDFGALVVSLRNRGQTIGEVAGRLISPRAKLLFLLVLFFALTIVLAIFGLVIAIIFARYPESVLSVWIEIPMAVAIGFWVYKKKGGLLWPSLGALALMYVAIYIGAYHLPISIPGTFETQVLCWTGLLFAYCFIASVLPVWTLLQPRDFINSHELILALILLVGGLMVASLTGQADLVASAPATVNVEDMPASAPPIFPFLFITIACGAISGFHCLVSSGTTSKQVENEMDAQYVGYGAMLLEGALAVVVILACCAGVGMGQLERSKETNEYSYVTEESGATVAGVAAWNAYYPKVRNIVKDGVEVEVDGWTSHGLPHKLGAFIDGGANFMSTIGIPLRMGVGIVAVLVASFAATTLDTATRLQRYVIQEIAQTLNFKPLTNMYAATALALILGGAMALLKGGPDKPMGTGGLILWPLFGATNQLLAGLAFMVTVFYLWRRKKPIIFAFIPMLAMIILPIWAMSIQMVGWYNADKPNWLLLGIGGGVMLLQVWMIIEALIIWPKAKGVLEEQLPPLEKNPLDESPLAESGGRSC